MVRSQQLFTVFFAELLCCTLLLLVSVNQALQIHTFNSRYSTSRRQTGNINRHGVLVKATPDVFQDEVFQPATTTTTTTTTACPIMLSRRQVLGVAASASSSSVIIMSTPFSRHPALAADNINNDNNSDDDAMMMIQRGNGFAYRFVPPPEMEAGTKPVKTHLFEVNWKSTTTPKYTFGITIDPVRINTLKEFGTPEEVAAKVVLAEVNRDGIFEVTLVKDPVAVVEEDGIISYILNYLSQGKRGDKRFVAKFCVQNQRLYALTAQVAETDYNDKEAELMKAINSFRVLPQPR